MRLQSSFSRGASLASILAWLVTTGIAMYAAVIGTLAWKDTHAIGRLDLKPQLRLRTTFMQIGDIPPRFTIFNEGPIDAVQMKIDLMTHRYLEAEDKTKKARLVTIWGTDTTWTIPKLPPVFAKSIEFPKGWLAINARSGEFPHHNVMEIRLTYRVEPDMRQFIDSAFYFVNPEGMWVKENNSSLTPEVYDPIKDAIYQRLGRKYPFPGSFYDTLHPVEEPK